MSERKRRFFSGPSLEAALVGAASEYGIPPEEVSYRVVEKRHGFLKIRRNTVIEVDPDAPRKSEAEAPKARTKTATKAAEKVARAREEPRPPRKEVTADGETVAADDGVAAGEEVREAEARPPLRPRSRGRAEARDRQTPEGPETREGDRDSREDLRPEGRRRDRRREEPEKSRREEGVGRGGQRRDARRRPRLEPPKPIEERLERARGEKAEAALEATEWLLDLVDLDVDPEIYLGEDRFEVELRGRDRGRLTPDNGKVLSALEHLIPRVMRGVCGDTHPVRVDSENYQALREDRLRELAWDTADKVRREGQATILEAMDPADRRIVHIAVSDDPDVTTRSLGDGFFKRVKVLPK